MADLLTGLRTRLASWLGGPGGGDGASGSSAASTPSSSAFPDAPPPTAAAAGWSPAAERALLDTLRVPSFAAAQDVVNALAMSEIAYTMAEAGPTAALASLRSARASFPPGLMTVGAVQATRRHVQHSYVLASAPGALLVAFAGTHAARDLLADADIRQTEVWLGGGGPSSSSAATTTTTTAAAAAVHRGFLARARGVPVDLLAAHAAAHGRRLVLCGHSLGGAVAVMCTLNLLRKEEEGGGGAAAGRPPVSCVSFAAPALGNAGLAALVASRPGWADRFYNLTFPDDAVPRMLAATPAALAAADAAAAAGAGGQAGAAAPGDATVSHRPFVPPSAEAVSIEEKSGGGGSGRWAAWVPAVSGAVAVPPAVTRAAAAVGEAAARAVPTSVAAAWSTAAGRAAAVALPDLQVLPDYAHFGQHHSPPVPDMGEDDDGWGREDGREVGVAADAQRGGRPPPPSLAADVQARLAALAAALPAAAAALPDAITRVPGLAAHRVATYRDRVRALARGVPGAPRAWPGGDGGGTALLPLPTLSPDVAPPLEPESARALLPPLPPASMLPGPDATGSGGLGGYWATVRRTAADLAARATTAAGGGGGNSTAAATLPTAAAAAAAATVAAQVSLTILVRGRGLASASGARVGVAASSGAAARAVGGGTRASPTWFPAAIRRRPPPASIGGGGGGGSAGDEGTMTVVARLPASVLRAAAAEEGGGGGPGSTRLSLALRSDCAASTVPLSLRPRTAWLVWAGRPGGGLPPALAALEPGVHNGVRCVAFDGPAAAWAALRSLDRAGSSGGGGGLLSGVRRWLSGGGGGSTSPPPFPDVVLALHDPAWLPGPRTAASLRDLAGRVRLAPVCCLEGGGGGGSGDDASAAVAAVSALYADGWLDRAPAVVQWTGGGGVALAERLEGILYGELLAASGGGGSGGGGAAPRL